MVQENNEIFSKKEFASFVEGLSTEEIVYLLYRKKLMYV